LQFYCELARDYRGADWGALATHNPVDHEERFSLGPPLDYPFPPRWMAGSLPDHFGKRTEQLRLELIGLYGDQAPTSSGCSENSNSALRAVLTRP
jgi:hypothetical protein